MNEAAKPVAHASQTRVYLMVFGALAVLTAVTVAVSYLHLSRAGAIAVALAVAATKVSLIVAFFMHLKHESKLIHGIFYAAVILVLGLLLSVLPDIGIVSK